MGQWSYWALEQVEDKVLNGGFDEKRTVVSVLRLFCRLNEILIQDAVAMMLEMEFDDNGNRLPTHEFFKKLPVFQTADFKVSEKFVEAMSYPNV